MMDKKEFIRWTAIFVSFGLGYFYGYLNGRDCGYKTGNVAGRVYFQEKRSDSILRSHKFK